MPPDAGRLQQAIAHHQAGQLPEAEALYRQILGADPDQPDALHMLGLLAHHTNHHDDAVRLMARSIELVPQHPQYRSNLGIVLKACGRLADAEACYHALIAEHPGDAAAHNNLGTVQEAMGRPAAAAQCYAAAIRLEPTYAEAHNNLGGVLQSDPATLEEAGAAFRAALQLRPEFARAHNNLGTVLQRQDQLAQAEACYREALRLQPNYPEAHVNLASVLHTAGRLADAEAEWRAALRYQPADARSHNGLGVTLQAAGRSAEAAESFRTALQYAPNLTDALSNLGNVLQVLDQPAESERLLRAALHQDSRHPPAHNGLGLLLSVTSPAEAETCFRTALSEQPDYAEAALNLSLHLLLHGRLAEAWPLHESRWGTRLLRHQHGRIPGALWHGEPLEGRTVLLHAEQGFGDTLQFCRYAPLVAEAGGRVVLEVPAPLVALLKDLPGVAQVIPTGSSLPPYDLQCPLLSLPRAFGTTLSNIPSAIPYLRADPARIAAWRSTFAGTDGLRVGLVWAGAGRAEPELAAVDRRRSVALATLASLGSVPDCAFVSLQTGTPALQAATPPSGMALYDAGPSLRDFADTAALIESLDLVIGVDTAVVHLAGALGKPVWLLNRFDTCWRWLLDRADSPWYPTLRQFRQARPNDWTDVVAKVRDALAATASSRTG